MTENATASDVSESGRHGFRKSQTPPCATAHTGGTQCISTPNIEELEMREKRSGAALKSEVDGGCHESTNAKTASEISEALDAIANDYDFLSKGAISICPADWDCPEDDIYDE